MRGLLAAVGVVVLVGCSGSVNGEVAGLKLNVSDSIFWYSQDTSGRVNGVYLTLADKPRLCQTLKANRLEPGQMSLSFTLFRLTTDSVLPPEQGDYTVTDVAEQAGNFAYAVFSRTDGACQETLSEPAGLAISGIVRLQRLRAEKGGNANGDFDVTFGTGDRVTGGFNAEYCDIAAAPQRPSCE
jgi:hypothetical protein